MFWPDPTHQPTHPPTHQTIHPPMGGGVSTDFKSSNRIGISWLVQVLLNFDWFWGFPNGQWGWVSGDGGGERMPSTHVHMHVYAHTCTHVSHHRESLGFPQIQWGQPFAWNYHVYHACMCMHVYMCMCMHVRASMGAPPTTPLATSQSCRESETPKFNNSWTSRDNLILFEDSLPLNIPELI